MPPATRSRRSCTGRAARDAARLEAEPAEDRLSVLEARVAMLTEAVAALVRDRDDDDDDEEGY